MATDIGTKIALLLAQAEGTDNPIEAETFARKAEELMLKYNIEQAEIQAKRPGTVTDEIVMEKVTVRGQYVAGLVTFGHAVGGSFNLRSYHQHTKLGTGTNSVSFIWLVGHKSDIEQATTLINSLLVQSDLAMKYWWRTQGLADCEGLANSRKYAARREFYFAFANGVRSRLAEVRKTVVHDSRPGTDLMLVDRLKKVDTWARSNVQTSQSRVGVPKTSDYNARVAGHAAGRDAVGVKHLN